MRKLAIIVALLVAAVVGVAASSALVPHQGDDTLNGPDAVQPDGSGAPIAVTAPAPDGRERVAVRVYRSKTGLTCPEAARTDGSNFGQIDKDGTFHPLDLQAAGSCTDLAKFPVGLIINNYAGVGDRPAYSVVFGVTSSNVTGLSIRLAGEDRPLQVTNGAYLAVTDQDALAHGALIADLDDGTTASYPLSVVASPTVDPTPPPAGS